MVISAHFYLPLISQEGHIHSVKQANIPTLEILKDMTVPSASVLEFSGTHPSGHFSQNFHRMTNLRPAGQMEAQGRVDFVAPGQRKSKVRG